MRMPEVPEGLGVMVEDGEDARAALTLALACCRAIMRRKGVPEIRSSDSTEVLASTGSASARTDVALNGFRSPCSGLWFLVPGRRDVAAGPLSNAVV